MFQCSVLVLTVSESEDNSHTINSSQKYSCSLKISTKAGLELLFMRKTASLCCSIRFWACFFTNCQQPTATPHSQAYPVFRNLVCNHNSTG